MTKVLNAKKRARATLLSSSRLNSEEALVLDGVALSVFLAAGHGHSIAPGAARGVNAFGGGSVASRSARMERFPRGVLFARLAARGFACCLGRSPFPSPESWGFASTACSSGVT